MSDKNTSTLQSYIDSATGAAQTLFGSITGNTTDQQEGQAKKDKAQAENDASHAGGTLAGYSVSSSGAVAKNDTVSFLLIQILDMCWLISRTVQPDPITKPLVVERRW